MLTPEEIANERASVVGSALGWLGTPYHHMAMVRNGGCDCVTFLKGSFVDARLPGELPAIGFYHKDWHLHRDAEKYLEGVLEACVERPSVVERKPEPADILLFKIGRVFSHGALVIDFPNLLHSQVNVGVARVNYNFSDLKSRETKVFTYKRWVE